MLKRQLFDEMLTYHYCKKVDRPLNEFSDADWDNPEVIEIRQEFAQFLLKRNYDPQDIDEVLLLDYSSEDRDPSEYEVK